VKVKTEMVAWSEFQRGSEVKCFVIFLDQQERVEQHSQPSFMLLNSFMLNLEKNLETSLPRL